MTTEEIYDVKLECGDKCILINNAIFIAECDDECVQISDHGDYPLITRAEALILAEILLCFGNIGRLPK